MALAQQLPSALEDSSTYPIVAASTESAGQVHLGSHSWPSFVAIAAAIASIIASYSSASRSLQHSSGPLRLRGLALLNLAAEHIAATESLRCPQRPA